MWEKPETNDLPETINLRGVTADQLAENWVMLPGFGRKEILIRCGVRGNYHIDVCMHEHLANLPGLVTNEELQKVVDILARHGKISGLHAAKEFNTVEKKQDLGTNPHNYDGLAGEIIL
ncbi:MAG: hypothetical protein WCK48_00135 [bacterium]